MALDVAAIANGARVISKAGRVGEVVTTGGTKAVRQAQELARDGYKPIMGNENVLARYTPTGTPRDIRILSEQTPDQYIDGLLKSSNPADAELGKYLADHKFLVRTEAIIGQTTADEIAAGILDRAKITAGKIENDMENAFNKIGDGKLLGLENKIKTQNSLVDKLVREAIDLKSLSDPLARAGSDVKDAVRYSAIFDADNFTSNAKKFMSELEQAGWERIKLKNTFKAGENFKGINTAWRNKSGSRNSATY